MTGLRGIKTTRTSKRRDQLRASNGNRIVDAMHEAVQLETLRTHARTIVEGEGVEETPSAAEVHAISDILGSHFGWRSYDAMADDRAALRKAFRYQPDYPTPAYDLNEPTKSDCDEAARAILAALSTIRKHQAGE